MLHALVHIAFALTFLLLAGLFALIAVGCAEVALDEDLALLRGIYWAMALLVALMAVGCIAGAVYTCLPC